MGVRHALSREQRPSKAQRQAPAFRIQTAEDLIDLEFSDYGRDPRFLPGWWIVPALLGTVVIVSLLLA